MTAVQKHQSRQQTQILGREDIAYRANLTAVSRHQINEARDGKFQLGPGELREPQPVDENERRVPRAFISPSGEVMNVPLSENNRLPAISPTSGWRGDTGRRQSSASSNSPFHGRHRRPSSSEVAAVAKDGRRRAAREDPSLQHLAADALQAFGPTHDPNMSLPSLTNDISISTRKLSLRDDHLPSLSIIPRDMPVSRPRLKSDTQSPPPLLTPASGELPPLQMDSPKSEGLGQSLPSLRSTLGDINHIPPELPPIDKETSISPRQNSKFPASPPSTSSRLPPISASHTSPPVSPNETSHRNLPSPHSLPSASSYGFPSGSMVSGSTYDVGRNGSDGEAPRNSSVSAPSQLSIDGITSGQIGSYVCTFNGCTAHPFQTQYLLNSHANVHSSARPHYCPVKGCPRSEGGKGFKRKNEMIRHGLVHDSPGYVCPFCPDREHKYPRPDNLQR